MKTALLSLALLAAFTASGSAQLTAPPAGATTPGVLLTRDEATKIKSYDVDEIGSKGPALEGQIVKVKFNYRTKMATAKPDGTLAGELALYRYRDTIGGGGLRYGSLATTVPAEGIAWFMKIPTEDMSRATLIVFARLGKSTLSGRPAAELLGREIKSDMKGSRIVW